ncbi:MAG: hypothetical protein ACLPVY_21695 [Acidimicrobiia bacterium]
MDSEGGRDRSGLVRWDRRDGLSRKVVCVGDSITYGAAGRAKPLLGVVGWVDQLRSALADGTGLAGGGFRGLWRSDEWTRTGSWTRTPPTELFDVAPFGYGYFSSGSSADGLRWTKPDWMDVAGFDLYWFHMTGTGDWHYRVDGGAWRDSGARSEPVDNRLHRLLVAEAVTSRVEIRGHDNAGGCIAPIAGISTFAKLPVSSATVVHNLGCPGNWLTGFCRTSTGDPLAFLDDLRPDLMTVLFSNDAMFEMPARFGSQLRLLVDRASDYADVLLISPFEQRSLRRVDDAITVGGSNVLRSPTASFGPADVSRAVAGTNIPNRASIAGVLSAQSATMSYTATGSSKLGELTIGRRRTPAQQSAHRTITAEVARATGCALLDLYDAWAGIAGTGWDAANAHGFMADALHPSQLGHDDIATRVKAMLRVGPR